MPYNPSVDDRTHIETSQRLYNGCHMRLMPWLVCAILILVSLGHWLNNIPLNQLFELNLFRAHYLEYNSSMLARMGIWRNVLASYM
jgi:hypothetical protein